MVSPSSRCSPGTAGPSLTAGAALGAADLTKFVPLLLAPFMLRRLGARFAAALAVVARSSAGPVSRRGHRRAGIGRRLPAASGSAPGRTGGWWRPGLADRPAQALLLAVLGSGSRRRAGRPPRDLVAACRYSALLLAGAMLASYSVQPWYLLWILPLLCVAPVPGLLWATGTVSAYYLAIEPHQHRPGRHQRDRVGPHAGAARRRWPARVEPPALRRRSARGRALLLRLRRRCCCCCCCCLLGAGPGVPAPRGRPCAGGPGERRSYPPTKGGRSWRPAEPSRRRSLRAVGGVDPAEGDRSGLAVDLHGHGSPPVRSSRSERGGGRGRRRSAACRPSPRRSPRRSPRSRPRRRHTGRSSSPRPSRTRRHPDGLDVTAARAGGGRCARRGLPVPSDASRRPPADSGRAAPSGRSGGGR